MSSDYLRYAYSYVLLALVVECKANAEYEGNTGCEALAVPAAQLRSGLECLDLRKRRHNNNKYF